MCQAGEAIDDLAIICQLSLYLADLARASLENLLEDKIYDWATLREVFDGNFRATFPQPRISWDLKNCRQKADESLCDYLSNISPSVAMSCPTLSTPMLWALSCPELHLSLLSMSWGGNAHKQPESYSTSPSATRR